MKQARGFRMGIGSDDLDPRKVLNGVADELRRRFKAVAIGPAAPGERRTDLIFM